MNQAEIRAALAKRGLTTKHIEQIEVLSSGEKAKVSLCKILNLETNLLILNEAASQLYVDAKRRIDACFKGISRKHLNGIPQT